MSKEPLEKRSVTVNDAIRHLAKNGVKVSEKEAEEILEFLYFLAKLIVNLLY
jgi:hypothetical protein